MSVFKTQAQGQGTPTHGDIIVWIQRYIMGHFDGVDILKYRQPMPHACDPQLS
jgi:hypothetical protein